MNSLVTIEVLDQWHSVPVGSRAPLRLSIRRPDGQSGVVILRHVGFKESGRVELNTDAFLRDIRLRPGEGEVVTVDARFHRAGPANLSEFFVQIDPEGGAGELIFLPNHEFRVVENLAGEVVIELARVCDYEGGAKVEITVRNGGATEWRDFGVMVGPVEYVRSGATCRREPQFRPGDKLVFEAVVESGTIEFELAGTASGDRVTASVARPVPASVNRPSGSAPFAFLEPRNLTHDAIRIKPETGEVEATSMSGVYQVYGGKTRYIVTVIPQRPGVRRVELFSASGVVEVEQMTAHSGAWTFLMTVIEDPTLTVPARLYYDVQTDEQTLRGELCLAIRPQRKTWLKLAMMIGIGVTLKGFAAITPSLFNLDGPPDLAEELPRLLSDHWLDMTVMLAVPLVFACLWFANLFARPFETE